MSLLDDRLYLDYILTCIARIEQSVAVGKDAFWANTEKQDAVLRNLQTLTESTQRLSVSLKSNQPDVDWKGMADFRNLVVHNYLGIDLVEVWSIIEFELPVLKQQIKAIRQSME